MTISQSIIKPSTPSALRAAGAIASQKFLSHELSDEFLEFTLEEQRNFRSQYLTRTDTIGAHNSLFCGI